MGSDIVPIRPGLEIQSKAHSELIHLYDSLSSKKQNKIRGILQQLVDLEQELVEPHPEIDTHDQPAGYFLKGDGDHLLYCVPINPGAKIHDGELVLVPNGEKAGMTPGARALRIEIKDNRVLLGTDSDFRKRDPTEAVWAVTTGHYTQL